MILTEAKIAQNYGFSGSYTDSQTWSGSMIGSSGAPMDAMVGIVSGNSVLTMLAEYAVSLSYTRQILRSSHGASYAEM